MEQEGLVTYRFEVKRSQYFKKEFTAKSYEDAELMAENSASENSLEDWDPNGTEEEIVHFLTEKVETVVEAGD